MSEQPISRLAFMSAEWLAMAERELQAVVAAEPGAASLSLAIVERLHGRPHDGPAADELHVRIDRGRVIVGAGGHAEPPDVEIDCDWAEAHRAAAMPAGDALAEFNRQRAAKGRLTVRGDPGPARMLLAAAHDRIAARTLPPNQIENDGEE